MQINSNWAGDNGWVMTARALQDTRKTKTWKPEGHSGSFGEERAVNILFWKPSHEFVLLLTSVIEYGPTRKEHRFPSLLMDFSLRWHDDVKYWPDTPELEWAVLVPTPAPLHSGCMTSCPSFDLQQFPFPHIGCENDSSTCTVVVEIKWDYPSKNAMQVAWLIGNVLGMSRLFQHSGMVASSWRNWSDHFDLLDDVFNHGV